MDDSCDMGASGRRDRVQPFANATASARRRPNSALARAIDFEGPLEDEGLGGKRSEISEDVEEPVNRPMNRYVAEMTELREHQRQTPDHAALTDPIQ